jgi:hypothetical protein
MVVGSEKEIAHAIFPGNNTAKAAHIDSLRKRMFCDLIAKIEMILRGCNPNFCRNRKK